MVKKKRAYNGEIDEFVPRHFHVLSHLCHGGTSEIYKAVDTRDNSIVVIKILPSDQAVVSQQEERITRIILELQGAKSNRLQSS